MLPRATGGIHPGRTKPVVIVNGVRWPPIGKEASVDARDEIIPMLDRARSSSKQVGSLGGGGSRIKEMINEAKASCLTSMNGPYDEESMLEIYREVFLEIDRKVMEVESYVRDHKWDGYYQKLVESIIEKCSEIEPDLDVDWDSRPVKDYFINNDKNKRAILRHNALNISFRYLIGHYKKHGAGDNMEMEFFMPRFWKAKKTENKIAHNFLDFYIHSSDGRMSQSELDTLTCESIDKNYFTNFGEVERRLSYIDKELSVGNVYSKFRILGECYLPGESDTESEDSSIDEGQSASSLKSDFDDTSSLTSESRSETLDSADKMPEPELPATTKVNEAAEEVSKALMLVNAFFEWRELGLQSGHFRYEPVRSKHNKSV